MRLLPLIVLSFIFAAGPGLGATTGDTSALPTIAKQVSGSKRMDGFFDLYWDGNQGRLYLQIDNFAEQFIYVSSLARGVGSNDLGLDRGQLGLTRLVEFQRAACNFAFALVAQRSGAVAGTRRSVCATGTYCGPGAFQLVAACSGRPSTIDPRNPAHAWR